MNFGLGTGVIITSDGYILSNLFACSNNINIKGSVYNVYSIGNTLTVDGFVYRDIRSTCNNLNINGMIARNVFVDCSSINFKEQSNTEETASITSYGTIQGNLNYFSKEKLSIPDGHVSGEVNFSQDGQVHDISGIAKCHSSGHNNSPKIAIPVIDVAHTEKNQNGKRFKENGDSMFTLTAQDRHGVGIGVRYTENGFHLYRKDKKKSTIQGTHVTYQNGNVQCLGTTHAPMTMEKIGIIDPQGRNNKEVSPKDICPTLRSETHGNLLNVCVNIDETSNYGNGIYVEMPEGFIVYAIWYEKYQCYIAIRKLTPKECFRLQGWADDYFEKAAFVSSDSQLYKQAGNGVTVDVVKAIGDKIKEYEKQRIPHNPRHDTAEQAGHRHKEQTRFGI